MKYRIRKHTKSYLKTVYDGKGKHHVEQRTDIWYQASRKGSIFGFWHAIGHEYWYDDLCPYKADTIEDMETYVLMYHNVRYKDDKIEIIKDIDL